MERYDNLQNNGRLNKITGKIISVLGIRLVMGTDGQGNIALLHKVRGEQQVLEKMLGMVEDNVNEQGLDRMVISHCNNPSLAQRLADMVKSRFNFKEILVIPTGGLSSLYADNKGIVMAF